MSRFSKLNKFNEIKENKKLRIAGGLIILLILGTIFYINFQNYQPKILKQLQEVKGAKTSKATAIPYPENTEQIGSDSTTGGTKLTFKTKKSPQDLQKFYKNIFLDEQWKVVEESLNKGFYTTKYKNGKLVATVVSSKQDKEDSTLASIEVLDPTKY